MRQESLCLSVCVFAFSAWDAEALRFLYAFFNQRSFLQCAIRAIQSISHREKRKKREEKVFLHISDNKHSLVAVVSILLNNLQFTAIILMIIATERLEHQCTKPLN